jgi:hypothetical protein
MVKESMGHAKLTATQRNLRSNAEKKREAVIVWLDMSMILGYNGKTATDETDAVTPS